MNQVSMSIATRGTGIDLLPMELWDYIIDHVATTVHGHAHLLDCSLVCQAWHGRCRFHLFKNVKIQDKEDAEAFAKCASIHGHFQMVERLTIYGNCDSDGRGPIPHLYIVAKKLFPVLPCLSDLILCDAEWNVTRGSHIDRELFRSLRTSSSIKRLHLDNVVIASNVVFARFIQALAYCEQVTFVNTRLGPNGMLFKRVAYDTMSLRAIVGVLSDRRGINLRQLEDGDSRSVLSGEVVEERIGTSIQSNATTDCSPEDPCIPLSSGMSNGGLRMCEPLARSSAIQDYSSEECRRLVDLLTPINTPLADVGGMMHDNQDPQDVLGIVRGAMSTKQGIQAIKEFAEVGYHQTAVNILDAVLDSIAPQIGPQSRLYTTVFHTLRKICTNYGDIPDSLVLPRSSIVLKSHHNRPEERGGFADIYLGQWGDHVVGIKAFRIPGHGDALDITKKNIAKEATLWRRLVHPNVVPFYGIDYEHFDFSMICKWMPNGHIMSFLSNHPDAIRPQLILDVARGLEYLHSDHVGIVHGDLKGGNVLVDEHNRACLSDFGLSTVMYDCDTLNTVTQMSNFSSTIRWMPPEILDPERYGLKSASPSREGDVYSFSMVTCEGFTGKVPFPHARNEGSVIRRIGEGERPPRPVEATRLGLSDQAWTVMERCWRPKPSARPSIAEVITRLEDEWSLGALSER
ncbi:kinase-like protein [Daedalea quercina L-15889]|uniref:Kinase-like protein n=1 Tax=Daedalea quercina L-15889 TaxID=1314783 RepID=A0A165TWS2_9APHY|nr:kinase-like protein [Daedalea quercina L-15889]